MFPVCWLMKFIGVMCGSLILVLPSINEECQNIYRCILQGTLLQRSPLDKGTVIPLSKCKLVQIYIPGLGFCCHSTCPLPGPDLPIPPHVPPSPHLICCSGRLQIHWCFPTSVFDSTQLNALRRAFYDCP